VKKSFEHGYLLDAIFALSSTHIAIESSDSDHAKVYSASALTYQNSSVSAMSVELAHISPDNCSSLALCSVLNLICTFVMPYTTCLDRQAKEPSSEILLRVANSLDGIGALMQHHHSMETKDNRLSIFANSAHPHPYAGMNNHLDLLNTLRKQIVFKVSPRSPLFQVYLDTVDDMERILRLSNGRSSFASIACMRGPFLQALKCGEGPAVAITMCWAVLLYLVDGTWWTMYVAKNMIEDLGISACKDRAEWETTISWCRSQVTSNPASARTGAVRLQDGHC
jgi:hypothetical protein